MISIISEVILNIEPLIKPLTEHINEKYNIMEYKINSKQRN